MIHTGDAMRRMTTETVEYRCDEPECPNRLEWPHYHTVVYVLDDPDALDSEELHPNAEWNAAGYD